MQMTDQDSKRTVTRGQFLAASAVGLGAVLAGCGSSGGSSSTASSAGSSTGSGTAANAATKLTKGGTLNIWTWPGYWAPKNLSGYKAATGTTVNIASYQSDDQMYAKLKTSAGADFDIAIPDLGWIPVFSQAGLVQKIDHDRVPFQYIEKSVLARPEDPNNEWSVPKDYAATGIVYDPTAVGGKLKTWHDFLDALSRPGVSGKAEMPSQASETLGVALWAMGKNWNTATQDDLTAAYNMLKPLVKHLKSFNDFDVAGVTNGSVVMAAMTNANARLAMLKNKKLAWVIPQPQSELILDSYVITHTAPDVDQAYSFIDYMLQPKQQIADTVYLGYPLVLPGIQSKVPKNMPLKEVVFVSPADLERLEPLNVREDVQGFAENLYTQLQAAA
jgi:spermidine/putrescine transport system substrate-binding protein